MKEISLQLYSIRDAVRDLGFEKVLEEVAKMGYTGVEFAGRGDVSAKDMKKYLDNAGLKAISSHTGYQILSEDLDAEMEYMSYLGAKYIACPSAPFGTLSQVEKTADVLNKVGEKMKANGLTLSYHNHAPELWLTVKGKPSLDYFYEITDPEFVKVQLDVFHVLRADVDPYEYVKKYAYRMPTIHLKQMESVDTKEDARAGAGVIDFKKIIDITSATGTVEYIYEDEGLGDQLEMARVSAAHLLKI